MKQSTETIISALRILAKDIQSEDGVANSAIREAADRLEELNAKRQPLSEDFIINLAKQCCHKYEDAAIFIAGIKAAEKAHGIGEYESTI